HLDGLGRLIAVVVGDEIDLAAVDAALVVDHLPECLMRLPDDAVGRRRTTVGVGVTDLDLGITCPDVVLLLGERCATTGKYCRRRSAGDECTSTGLVHVSLPVGNHSIDLPHAGKVELSD